eukprot:159453_1
MTTNDLQESKRNLLLSTTNLYIEGIPKEWTSDDLKQAFNPFGTISAARILVDKVSNASREVGFVHFTNHENALRAMETLQGHKPHETAQRSFKINFAKQSRKKGDVSSRSKASSHFNSNAVGQTHPQPQINVPRFDKPCRYFQHGNCKHGENCLYRHGNAAIAQSHTNNYGQNGIPVSTLQNSYNPYNANSLAAYYQYYYGNTYYGNTYPQQYYPQQTTTYPNYYSQFYTPTITNATPLTQHITNSNFGPTTISTEPSDEKTSTEPNGNNKVNTVPTTSNTVPTTHASVNAEYGASRQETSTASNVRWEPYKTTPPK